MFEQHFFYLEALARDSVVRHNLTRAHTPLDVALPEYRCPLLCRPYAVERGYALSLHDAVGVYNPQQVVSPNTTIYTPLHHPLGYGADGARWRAYSCPSIHFPYEFGWMDRYLSYLLTKGYQ